MVARPAPLSLLLATLAAGILSSTSPPAQAPSLRVALADASAPPRDALPGTMVMVGDGSGRQRRLSAVAVDPSDLEGEIVLYRLSEPEPQSGELGGAGLPDTDGRRVGFALDGSLTSDIGYQPTAGKLVIACAGRAESKCVRFGCKPWRNGPDGSALLPYCGAFVRLVGVDYAGAGRGVGKNNQPIDIYDSFGFTAPADDKAYEF